MPGRHGYSWVEYESSCGVAMPQAEQPIFPKLSTTIRALTAGIEGIPAVPTGANPDGFGARTMATLRAGNAGDPLCFLWIELRIELFADEGMQ